MEDVRVEVQKGDQVEGWESGRRGDAEFGMGIYLFSPTTHSNDSASKSVSTVQTDTIATSRPVNLDPARVWLEALGRVLGRDPALDGETPGGDAVLCEAELGECCAGGDLNLGGDNVDACDLLGNGVLDLDTRVDLDEVVSVLLVNEELCCTGIAVVDRLGQLHGIVQHGISCLDGQVLGRGDLNDLLVSPLDGAVTLVQMNDVAVVVSKQLDLNMLGLVEEALDEDSSVSESRLGLGRGSLKGLLKPLGLPDNTHTTAATTKGSLDDDWESILIGETLDILESLHSTLGSWDDGDTGGNGERAGGDFVAESGDHLG